MYQIRFKKKQKNKNKCVLIEISTKRMDTIVLLKQLHSPTDYHNPRELVTPEDDQKAD